MASQRKLDHNFIVTDIIPLKRNRNKFDLLLSHHKKIKVSSNTILEFKIQKGDTLSKSILDSLIRFDKTQTLKERILIYLAYRSRSKNEILQHFKNKGFPDDLILIAIGYLEEKGYVDDVSFAKRYVKHLVEIKLLGEKSVRNKLYQHCINPAILDEIIEKVYKKNPPNFLIKKIIKKKSFTIKQEMVNNQKIVYHLKRKGFLWEDISEVLSKSEL